MLDNKLKNNPIKRFSDDISVFEDLSNGDTVLYNEATSKIFSEKNLEVLELIENEEEKQYLYARKTVSCGSTTDELSMLIDVDNFETDGFYSSLQDRYIKIHENDGVTIDKDYSVRLVETELEEVDSYLEFLEARRVALEKENAKTIKKVLVSKLNN